MKKYIIPRAEVLRLHTEDVIATSFTVDPSTTTTDQWTRQHDGWSADEWADGEDEE